MENALHNSQHRHSFDWSNYAIVADNEFYDDITYVIFIHVVIMYQSAVTRIDYDELLIVDMEKKKIHIEVG